MTDPAAALIWSQACEALAQDQYELGQKLLSDAHDRSLIPRTRARLTLYLLSVLSLYAPGDSPENFLGLHEEMQAGLQEALQDDPRLSADGLYQALRAEAQARQLGPQAAPPSDEARHALGPDGPLARYHSVCALSLQGRYPEIAAIAPAIADLPQHLRWRLRQWQARAEEAQDNLPAATHLYADAAHLTHGINRAAMLQEEAALYFQQGQFEVSKSRLAQAKALYPKMLLAGDEEGNLGLATWHYLQAQVDLATDELDSALHNIEQAAQLEQRHVDPSYGVALVWGQILSTRGQTEEALTQFQRALSIASAEDQPYAHHELGVAFLDLDRPLEAREHLEAALQTPHYPFGAEVLADLAESDYRLGHLKEAQEEAENALQQGASVPARLVLGSIAMEYYHLDEALEHYQRVAQEAAPASRDWLTAHQMAADILAQQGYPDAAAAYAHAQQALEHTDPSDDWHATLEDHLQKAGALIGKEVDGRTLN